MQTIISSQTMGGKDVKLQLCTPPPKKKNPKKPQQKQQLINISSILVITINDFTKVEKIIVRCHCPIFVYNRSPMINPRW
jgi:hypothetical protein